MTQAFEEIEMGFKCGCFIANVAIEELQAKCKYSRKEAIEIIDGWDQDINLANKKAFRRK